MTDTIDIDSNIQTNPAPSIPNPPKKSNKAIIWIIIVCALCLGCITIIGVSVMLAKGIKGLGNTSQEATTVIESYIRDMAAREYEPAYDLLCPKAQKKVSVEDLKKLTEGNNYELYDGFESISIVNFRSTQAFNTNPNLPQGDVLTLDGSVIYSDDFTGTFSATLEKVDGEWKIFSIFITIPPNKVENSSGWVLGQF
jgi:hypothetical protein